MYICEKCKETFEEPMKLGYEPVTYQASYACPFCAYPNYKEAAFCDVCEEWYDPDEVTNGVCDECLKKAIKTSYPAEYVLSDRENRAAFAEYVSFKELDSVNKKIGNDFETELCNVLFGNGYWVHNFANKRNGQPADIIAVKDMYAYLIDAKVCSDGTFKLSRIEENQRTAMELWETCGNSSALFALKITEKEIYIITFDKFRTMMNIGKKEIKAEEIRDIGTALEDFLC